MKLYREVKASGRLPDKDGDYFTNWGSLMWDAKDKTWFDLTINYTADYWLEPIEITEEDIRKQSEEYEHEQSLGMAEDYANEDFIAGVNWVLSKLKGNLQQ